MAIKMANPPNNQKGRGKPPISKRNPPILGPNIVPIPKKDSARAVALPWFSTDTCLPARVKAAGLTADSPMAVRILIKIERPKKTFPSRTLSRNPRLPFPIPTNRDPKIMNCLEPIV